MSKKDKRPERSQGSFADQLASATGAEHRAQTADSRRFSAEVKSPDRAGRAPYNFVPLPKSIHWIDPDNVNAAPPPHDRYVEGLLSGEIDLQVTALTNFYCRGMWPLKEFVERSLECKDQTLPFLVDGELRLPGSSLRGMFRNLVEILGKAPLDPVNNTQIFFRAVASSSNPSDRGAFDPQAVSYKGRIDRGRVRAGYLYGGLDEWYIQPAVIQGGRQWYRVRIHEEWIRRKVWFRANGRATRAGDPLVDLATGRQPGFEEGTLVCSGPMPPKKSRDGSPIQKAQWVIQGENTDETVRLVIPEEDVKAYKDGGETYAIKEHGFEYSNTSKGIPCFYVTWNDAEGKPHVSFGATFNFRLPYQHTVRMAIPPTLARTAHEKRWDIGQSLFGRIGERECGVPGQRGRVFFEDGLLADAPPEPYEKRVRSIVLGGPKPSLYQHYLVQPTDRTIDSIHWDGNYKGESTPVVRGHKLYFHRPDAPLPEADSTQGEVATQLQPAKRGAMFQTRVRFENLHDWELGLLLTTIELPEGCAHRLGMGKPLGLGSFSIRISKLTTIDRKRRYLSFATGSGGLETGATVCSGAQLAEWKRLFARWYLGDDGDVWSDARLAELKAILTYDGLPPDWLNITRYLDFGFVPRPGPANYNEYRQVGYPGIVRTEIRRPLPAATQVLKAGREIPRDSRPPFERRTKAKPGRH